MVSGIGEIFSAGLYYKNIDNPIEREGFISMKEIFISIMEIQKMQTEGSRS
jgi:hypothetical protein